MTNFKTILILLLGIAVSPVKASADPEGNYLVPVPSALAHFGVFDIKYDVVVGDDRKLTLRYELPEDVAGPKKRTVVLKETDRAQNGFTEFEGKAHATCRKTPERLTCFVLYPGMSTAGVSDLLQEKYANDPALELRLKVARFFSADPKGIVNVALPKP